ncbi:MAG: hypothetical protein NUV73_01845 [Candidatus Daviesbacteria bacterium]|nr:hypothetical protein [Candidatus Daviesbacteria bacterium]
MKAPLEILCFQASLMRNMRNLEVVCLKSYSGPCTKIDKPDDGTRRPPVTVKNFSGGRVDIQCPEMTDKDFCNKSSFPSVCKYLVEGKSEKRVLTFR